MNHRWKTVIIQFEDGISHVKVVCPQCGHVVRLGHFLEGGPEMSNARHVKPYYLIGRKKRVSCLQETAKSVLEE